MQRSRATVFVALVGLLVALCLGHVAGAQQPTVPRFGSDLTTRRLQQLPVMPPLPALPATPVMPAMPAMPPMVMTCTACQKTSTAAQCIRKNDPQLMAYMKRAGIATAHMLCCAKRVPAKVNFGSINDGFSGLQTLTSSYGCTAKARILRLENGALVESGQDIDCPGRKVQARCLPSLR